MSITPWSFLLSLYNSTHKFQILHLNIWPFMIWIYLSFALKLLLHPSTKYKWSSHCHSQALLAQLGSWYVLSFQTVFLPCLPTDVLQFLKNPASFYILPGVFQSFPIHNSFISYSIILYHLLFFILYPPFLL